MDMASGFSLDILLNMLRRRFWVAVTLFSVVLTATVSSVFFLPDIYTTTSVILVEGQQVPQDYVKSTVTMGLERRLQTISQEILSRSRLEQIIEQYGLYREMKKQGQSNELMIQAMRDDIGIQIVGRRGGISSDTVAFEVSYTNPDPQKSMTVTNALASFYIEENAKFRVKQSTGTTEFLGKQIEETKKKLDEYEKQVTLYKQRNMGELPEQLASNLSTLTVLQKQMEVLSESISHAQTRRDLLMRRIERAQAATQEEEALAIVPLPSDSRGVGQNTGPVRLETLKKQLAQLRSRFSDKHPDVIQLKQQIAALEEHQQNEPANTREQGGSALSSDASRKNHDMFSLEGEHISVDADIRRLMGELDKVRNDIVLYQKRIENTPQHEQELSAFSRDYTTTRDSYELLLKKYDEAQVADKLEELQKGERFKLLEAAVFPTEPTAPKRGRFFLIGLALSLGTAAAGVLLWEMLDTSFHRVDDLRRFTKVPVVAAIPQIVTKTDRWRVRFRRSLGATALAVTLLVLIGTSYWFSAGNEQLVRLLVRPSTGALIRE